MTTITKHPGDTANISITVKNVGTGSATWGIDWDLENGITIKSPSRKTVTLAPGETKSLTWSVTLPSNEGTARLVVYWSDPNKQDESVYPNHTATDWWISIKGVPSLSVTGTSLS